MILFSFFHQYPALPDYYKFILVTVLVLMTLIEAIRLFLGYAGNLQEKVTNVLTVMTTSTMYFGVTVQCVLGMQSSLCSTFIQAF